MQAFRPKHMFNDSSNPQRTRGLDEFLANEAGVTALEYGLLAALIVVMCIAAFKLTGSSLVDLYVYWTAAVIAVLRGS